MPRTSPERSPEPRDDPMRGIPLLLAAVVLFSISDALAKYLGQTLPPMEIVWLRYCSFFALTLLPLAARPGLWRARSPKLQLLRGLGVAGSAVFFTTALTLLPMAEATAINFVSPAFVTILSICFLGERVGWRRWSAIAVGMAGMLIIVRPGAEAFQPAALLPVISSFSWACAVIVTRRMGATEAPATTLMWTAGTGLVVATLLLPFLGSQIPDAREILLGLLLGAISFAPQWLVVLAYRAAPASVLAPFSYSQIVFSGLLGLFVFGAWPDQWTLIGAAVIAASGLYSAHRETLRARERLNTAPPAA
jgi:drug/metabolite transporter (DMT)-like permease